MIPDYLFDNDTDNLNAIALNYDGSGAPKLSAKGDNDLAKEIIKIAIENRVPIYQNPELSEWLSQMEIGDEIPEMLYQVIAEILAFVFYIEGKNPSNN